MESDALARLYATAKEEWYGKLVDTDWAYLECGRKQKMPFYTQNFPTRDQLILHGMNAFSPVRHEMQVTIRDVKISASHQHSGLFTNLIKYMLCEEKVSVQLEAVNNKGLMQKLEASPLWIRQTQPEYMDCSAGYVRFCDPNSVDKKYTFSLF